jgi:hydroxymethylbilane synthase
VSLPAIGQGALAVEGRSDDAFIRSVVAPLEHPPTRLAVTAERGLLLRLEGGCQVPIGAHATVRDDLLAMDALVASVDGGRLVRDSLEGPATEAQALGVMLAERLLALGADAILHEIYGRA